MAMNLLLGVLLLLTSAMAVAQEPDDWEARIMEVKGDVLVFSPDGDPEGVEAEKDMPLEVGDRIKTGEDSSAEIVIEGDSAISLKPNSDFTLTSLRRADSEFKLQLGSLLARIRAALGGGASMRVRTPTAVAAVRGTEFAVEVPAETPEETHVGVFDEGKVAVSSEGGEELLIAGQETVVRRGVRPLPPYLLKRLARHRQFVRAMRKRAPMLRKMWKSLPPEERRKLRGQIIERWRQRRQQMLERRRRLQEGRRQNRQELREDQRKMERRREEIRRRRLERR